MNDPHHSTSVPVRRRSRACAVLAAVAACAILFAASPARAVSNVIPVTTTEDEVSSDGDCSLREAIIAANANATVDACPSGSSAATDIIELVAGSTYLLTLPEPGDISDVDPEGGDLNIDDGAAGIDVFLRSDHVGTMAAIEQTVPGVRVIRTQGSLRLLDVEISGGQAADCGAGVQAIGAVTIDVQHAIFSRNGGPNGAALCMLSPSSVATISDSLFADNRGASANGGALFNKGTMTITDSAFVRNEGLAGSAVHHQSGAVALTITNSCFADNGNEAVANSDDTTVSATGCWWRASNGPSGEGPGGGDAVGAGVDFSSFLTAVPAACRPLSLERNGAFQLFDFDGDPAVPTGWKLARVDLATEGRRCDQSTGGCFVRLDGDGRIKTVKQIVRVAGTAGDQLTFRAQSRAKDVPASAGPYRVRLIVVHQDGSRQIKALSFSAGTHDFEKRAKTLIASEAYKKVQLEIAYGRASGIARFDEVSLTIEP